MPDDESLTLIRGGVAPAVVGGADGVVLGEVEGDFIVPGSGGLRLDIL